MFSCFVNIVVFWGISATLYSKALSWIALVHLLKGLSTCFAHAKTRRALHNWNIMPSLLPCPRSSPPLVKKKARSSVGCWLPWWCVFLGWFLLLSISGVSIYFTLLYSFEYGREKSIKWVMSLGLSLFQSIFILQPLKVCKGWETSKVTSFCFPVTVFEIIHCLCNVELL